MHVVELEDCITECLCLLQKMYSVGSIDEQKRDALKELVFDEDPGLLSYFSQPGSDLKSIESLIINHFPHPEKADRLSLFNNESDDKTSTVECTPLLDNNNIAELEKNKNCSPASLFALKPVKLLTE